MNYRTMKVICSNRGNVFSNSATGGGDPSTDTAPTVDPNQHLAPIIGGSAEFNTFIAVSVAIALLMLGLLVFKQYSKQLN